MHADFIVIGAGIVGLTIAETIKHKFPDSSVVVLEKEKEIGLHSSGRNSGVMHSGIYYPAASIKAKVCGQGAKEMINWCSERGLRVNKIGKVIVPVRVEDGSQSPIARAPENGVAALRIDEYELRNIEAEAHSATGEVIYCPETSVIDPKAVLAQKESELRTMGISIELVTPFKGVDVPQKRLFAGNNFFSYEHVVNAAGLNADKVAYAFGVAQELTLLPFKGMYWKLAPQANIKLKHLICPVPDFRVPFLGVHTTTTIDGSVYLGPTAAPALGRENYHGLRGVSLEDTASILFRLAEQFAHNKQGFRNLVYQETPKYLKQHFYKAARAVLPNLKYEDLVPCSKVGIRAQMLDTKSKELVTDFLIKTEGNHTHVLNAISPAFTSSMPFA